MAVRDLKGDDRLDPLLVCQDFPLLRDAPLAQGLHYLDNAATTHKPQLVIDAIKDCYGDFYGPIHRGLYPLAEEASRRYERARARLATFLGAASADEVVFTRSATEAINMVAWGWARERLQPGDRIWVSRMEHHANYLPWQRICRDRGAELRIIELHEDGSLDLAGSPELFAPQTRLIALCQVSNVLGVENPLRELCATARAHGIPVMVDAAQGVSHLPLDVCELGCDFLACSAHKMYGPSGIGLLYGRAERLQEMVPLLLGGGMVDEVGEGAAESTWTQTPARFEAGSPNLAGAVAFAAAADYLEDLDRHRVQAHLTMLTTAAAEALAELPGLRLLPPAETPRSAILSFTLDAVHPHDLAQVAGERGVAIRAGHHCAQPLMRSLGLVATARASFGVYNDMDDVEALVRAVDGARRLFS
ncbi:MAG: SufS family cysteine desulfurase [Gammaproteobacteria bacterium]|nr:SufS family cysteine desulfurase [Gammaproteobacteria bacterium]